MNNGLTNLRTESKSRFPRTTVKQVCPVLIKSVLTTTTSSMLCPSGHRRLPLCVEIFASAEALLPGLAARTLPLSTEMPLAITAQPMCPGTFAMSNLAISKTAYGAVELQFDGLSSLRIALLAWRGCIRLSTGDGENRVKLPAYGTQNSSRALLSVGAAIAIGPRRVSRG